MKFLLINGSLAEKSHTFGLLTYIEKLFVDKGHEVIVWDLREKVLPSALPAFHRDPTQNPHEIVREFAAVVDSADGYILGSPLYHASYSGMLKNALDNLRSNPFQNKWVGLVGNVGSARADALQLHHLRDVVRALYGYVLQSQLATISSDYTDSDNGYVLSEPSIQERAERIVNEIIKRTEEMQK